MVAKTGSLQILKLLVKYGAVSCNKNNKLENPLHIAAVYSQWMFIEEFIRLENSSEKPFQVVKPSVQVLNKDYHTPSMVIFCFC